MTKARFTLPNGAIVDVDGEAAEIKDLLDHYGGSSKAARSRESAKKTGRKKTTSAGGSDASDDATDLNTIVNAIKDCDLAEVIEKQILDKKSQVDRVLLPLYATHEFLSEDRGLTSSDITKITKLLRVPIARANVAKTLTGSASKYVMGDAPRAAGAVPYKLNRRGVTYLKGVLTEKGE